MIDSMLQLFLYIDVFVLGVLLTIGIQHAYSHYLQTRHPERLHHDPSKEGGLPQEVKERLLKDSRDNFQNILDTSADRLQHDLKSTSDRINLHLEELGNKIIDQEMKRYRQELDQQYKHADKNVDTVAAEITQYIEEHKEKLGKLHEQTDTIIHSTNADITEYKNELKKKLEYLHQQADDAISDVSGEITEYKEDLKQKLAAEVAEEKQQLLKQIDTKLADAVTSFLLETLQHNVDLGAQSSYLTSVLEEHKDELAKEAGNEAAK